MTNTDRIETAQSLMQAGAVPVTREEMRLAGLGVASSTLVDEDEPLLVEEDEHDE